MKYKDYYQKRHWEAQYTKIRIYLTEEQNFWYILNKLGWGTKSTNYNDLGEQLTQYIKKVEDIERLRRISQTFREELSSKIDMFRKSDNWSEKYHYWGGDDSYWDFTSHIVGMGKEMYDKVCADPTNMSLVGNNYKENFEYTFSKCKEFCETDEGKKILTKNNRLGKLERIDEER